MSMMRFGLLFREIAERETGAVRVPEPSPLHGDLPVDEYGFDELYCTEHGCDCRRVMINVLARNARQHLATINHAFEKPAKGAAAPEQTFLDPLNKQSRYAPALLELFTKVAVADPAYRERLERHYRLFKEVVDDAAHPAQRLLRAETGAASEVPMPAGLPSRQSTTPIDQAEILRDYKVLRRASVPLNTRLVKTLNRDEIGAAAAALGMLHGKRIDLETEDEIAVMMDYAIHYLFRDGRNAVDRLLDADPPPEGSPELRLLRSMRKSQYTIFTVHEPITGLGVHGLEGPQRTPIVIVDQNLSGTAAPGTALATRIHSPGEGWWMTTGAALPLNQRALGRMIRDLEDYERRFGAEPTEQERTTIIIRACVASGASRSITYADAGGGEVGQAAAPVRRDSSKVGRNDPCPCGSGKKHKKCCGA